MLVDTNVLVDVLQDDPDWADWSIAQLRAQSRVHRLTINPIIYAELSLHVLHRRGARRGGGRHGVADTGDSEACAVPGRQGVRSVPAQRRDEGQRARDFFIGAHAAVSGMPVLTRDTARYKTYFPSVRLVAPG
jgi:predicted nucleic acid-binding protein